MDQLDQIDGIGPTIAKRIVEYRTAHGGFRSLAELRDVDGIGEKRFERFRARCSHELAAPARQSSRDAGRRPALARGHRGACGGPRARGGSAGDDAGCGGHRHGMSRRPARALGGVPAAALVLAGAAAGDMRLAALDAPATRIRDGDRVAVTAELQSAPRPAASAPRPR